MKVKHVSENKKFDATIHEDLHEQWFMMIRDWESDKSNLNPYIHTEKGISGILHRSSLCTYICPASNLAEVRQELAKADEEEITCGAVSHQVPGSVFIRNGLEIEEQQ